MARLLWCCAIRQAGKATFLGSNISIEAVIWREFKAYDAMFTEA